MHWRTGCRHLSTQLFVVCLAVSLGLSCSSSEPTASNDVAPRIVSLVIVPDSLNLLVGDTLTVHAVFLDDNGDSLRASRPVWSCTNPSVALVDSAGALEAISEGRALLRAAAGGFEDAASVLVDPDPIIGLQVTPDTTRLLVGEERMLVADYVRVSGRKLEAQSVSWVSETGSVVGIDATGRIAGMSPGKGVIRATADTFAAEAVVFVPGWFQLPPLPEPRRAGHAAAVGGRIYYIGGKSSGGGLETTTYVYDISSHTWSTGPPMPTARDHGATAVLGDRIHIIGGNCYLKTHEVLYTTDMTWTTAAPIPFRFCGLRADTLTGFVYTLGGSQTGPNDTVMVYNPAADSWAFKDRIPYRRTHFAVGSINGNFYLAGMSTVEWKGSTLLVYDPARDKWHEGPEMPTPRYFVNGVVWQGRLFTLGGARGYDVVKDAVESYDPSIDAWSVHSSLPVPRQEVRAVLVDGVIYVIGGAINDYDYHTEATDRVDGYVP
jgi:N-acetylneuraminic acid mutarotase